MKFLLSSWLLAAALCASVHAWAQQTYRLELIATSEPFEPNYSNPSVTDLNNKGAAVGTIYLGRTRPFVWKDGEMHDPGDLQGGNAQYAEALGINDRGVIVGVSLSDEFTGFRPFIIDSDGIRDLGSFPGANAVFAHDINDRGEVIAEFYANEDGGPFVQKGSSISVLEGLGPSAWRTADQISARGNVAGTSDSPGGQRAVIWEQGVIRDLGVPPGGTSSRAMGINRHDQVVGSVTFPEGSRAFLWEDGSMRELPPVQPGNYRHVQAWDINKHGKIVGTAFPDSGSSVALLWQDYSVYDLNDLVHAADPRKPYVHLVGARHVNDRGQIVATGWDSRAPNFGTVPYLLTPVDDDEDDEEDE